MTTALFDDKYEVLYDHINIHNIPRLTGKEYYARGCTALLDAVGRTIDTVGKRLSATVESDRPSKILFVITTDGYENASRDYTKKKVKEMINLQQDTYSWKFLFLGADIDAVGEADSIGIREPRACRPAATSSGISSSFHAVSHITQFLRETPRLALNDAEFDDNFDKECALAFLKVE